MKDKILPGDFRIDFRVEIAILQIVVFNRNPLHITTRGSKTAP